jgi:hypothetical protein
LGLFRQGLTSPNNYDQSQIIINLYKDTTASRADEQLKKSPPPPRLRLRYGYQWAATPKLTMIAGAGNFPSGSSRCESSLLNPTIAPENAESRDQAGEKCAEGL